MPKALAGDRLATGSIDLIANESILFFLQEPSTNTPLIMESKVPGGV